MSDPHLMRGSNWVRCCICGEVHVKPYPDLFIDQHGALWDVCKGHCADEAGLTDE